MASDRRGNNVGKMWKAMVRWIKDVATDASPAQDGTGHAAQVAK